MYDWVVVCVFYVVGVGGGRCQVIDCRRFAVPDGTKLFKVSGERFQTVEGTSTAAHLVEPCALAHFVLALCTAMMRVKGPITMPPAKNNASRESHERLLALLCLGIWGCIYLPPCSLDHVWATRIVVILTCRTHCADSERVCVFGVAGLFTPSQWGKDNLGVHELCHKAIQSAPVDLRKGLARNIYLSGGTTLIPGAQTVWARLWMWACLWGVPVGVSVDAGESVGIPVGVSVDGCVGGRMV